MTTMNAVEMEEFLNEHACRVARSLGSSGLKKLGTIYFTGLKDGPDGKHQLVGQWIDARYADSGTVYYVNIPNMDHGPIKRGGLFILGEERITLETPPEEIERLVRAGHALLLEKAAEYWRMS